MAQTTVICLALGSTSSLLFAWLRGNPDDALRVKTPGIVAVCWGHARPHRGLRLPGIGFPLPPPTMLFLPYFSTMALAAQAALGITTCVALFMRARRSRRARVIALAAASRDARGTRRRRRTPPEGEPREASRRRPATARARPHGAAARPLSARHALPPASPRSQGRASRSGRRRDPGSARSYRSGISSR